MKISRAALPLVLLVAIVAAGCGGGKASVPADAVAVVDGTAVPRADLDGVFERARLEYKSQQREFPKAGTQEFQGLQIEVVAFLVQRVTYEKEAESLGIQVTKKQVDDRFQEILKLPQFGGNRKKLEAEMKKAGFTEETLRTDIRSQLVTDRLFEKITDGVSVTDAEIRKSYEENKAQYQVPESREVRHILVETKAKANEVLAELKGGAKFEDLAKKYSTDPGSKDTGGKYTAVKGQSVPEFEKAAYSLKTNEISAPIKTQFGFHIIQPLAAVKPGSTTPFAEVKESIKSTLEQQKKNDVASGWAEDTKKKYLEKTSYASGFAPPEEAVAPVEDDTEN